MDIAAPCDEAQVTRKQLEVRAASEMSETPKGKKVLSQSQFENTRKSLISPRKKEENETKSTLIGDVSKCSGWSAGSEMENCVANKRKKENKANLIEVQKHLVRGLRGLESL
jgi:hypothetical protein